MAKYYPLWRMPIRQKYLLPKRTFLNNEKQKFIFKETSREV